MPRILVLCAVVLLLSTLPVQAQFVPTFEPAPCPIRYAPHYDVTCGYVVTPEHHSDRDGATIRVMVAIFPARSATPAEPIIYLQGGPGSSGMARFASGLDSFGETFIQNHAFILLDQRGIGNSLPSLDCPEINELHDSALGGQACYDRLVADGVDISAYTTVESAGDVIASADALGYEQVSLFGSSYGSTLAMTVMRHYPDRVRSVILEGVTPPEVDLSTSWASSLQRAWDQVVADCDASERCAAAYPNLDAMLVEVVQRLNAEPLALQVTDPNTGELIDLTVDGEAVLSGLQSAMYSYALVPRLPLLIAALYAGENEAVIQMAESLAQNNVDRQSEGAFYAMRCSDDVLTTNVEADQAVLASVRPIFAEHFRDGYTAWEPTCALWGTQLDPVENTPVVSDIPTLMLNGAYDPVTPPHWADAAAEQLTYGYSYTFPESTHGVLPDFCATRIVEQFLADPFTEPSHRCLDRYAGVAFQLP
jgi:pimeloyl-ACP methyl ester carboxylesterase